MVRLLICLLILCSNPLYSLPSPRPASDSVTCFTDAELEVMEAEAVQIMEDAVAEAVTAAVVPYVTEINRLNTTVERVERKVIIWKVTTGIGIITSIGFMLFALLK